jgi:glucose-6-phosphate dehydrogenase assembly protein OpcA
MEAAMIVDLPGTTTNEVSKKITGLREEGGALTLSRVLTLVIALDRDDGLEDAVAAANFASREHPCRVIVVLPGDRKAAEPTLDAEIRVGADAGAGEVVVLRLNGELADHANSVVLPFLLPDTPVVAWWPGNSPAVPAEDPLGQLAIRRITDATSCSDPLAAIKSRAQSYTAGDTDLAWSRVTYWRALLASALDQGPFEPVQSAVVSGRAEEPALDILAGWLASRIDGTVQRAVGDLKGELHRQHETVTLSRPQTGVTATLSRTGRPEALIPLARRDTDECLAEDMRRLDADETYFEALAGIDKVQYQ